MVRAYRYLYFRIYAWNLRMWGESDLPQYNVCFCLAFLAVVNLLSIGLLLRMPPPESLKIIIVALFGGILLAHFQYFIRGRRYLSLEHEFRENPIVSSAMGLVVVWAYVAGSLGVFFLLLLVRA